MIAAASLVGITTAATAGVIMLGSNAIVSPKTPPAAAGQFFDSAPLPGGNPVITVPRPHVQLHVPPATPKVAPAPPAPSIIASPTVTASPPTASPESVRVPVAAPVVVTVLPAASPTPTLTPTLTPTRPAVHPVPPPVVKPTQPSPTPRPTSQCPIGGRLHGPERVCPVGDGQGDGQGDGDGDGDDQGSTDQGGTDQGGTGNTSIGNHSHPSPPGIGRNH